MTDEQLKALGPGDIIKHKSGAPDGIMVTRNYGDRVTAVKTFDITNPYEWILVAVSKYESPHAIRPPSNKQSTP